MTTANAYSATIKKRLQDPDIQSKVGDVFLHYYDDLQEILNVATVESGGIRPDGLANEVYACFHHMARALCEADANVDSEFKSAQKSHLKRATLDAYKIAINSYLSEDQQKRDVLDYMVLVEDFTKFIPDGLDKVNKVKERAHAVKKHYNAAKRAEIFGSFDKAIESFNLALEQCIQLREDIRVFTADKSYILACAREAKKDRDKAKDRRFTLLTVVLSALLAALFAALASQYVPKLIKRAPKPTSASQAAGS